MVRGKIFKNLVFIIPLIPLVSCSANNELFNDVFDSMNKIIVNASKFHYEKSFENNYISELYANNISITTDSIDNINTTYTIKVKQQDGTYVVDIYKKENSKDLYYYKSYKESKESNPFSSIGNITLTGYEKSSYSNFDNLTISKDSIKTKDEKGISHIFLIINNSVLHRYNKTNLYNDYLHTEKFTKLDNNFSFEIPKVFVDLKAASLISSKNELENNYES